MRWLAVWTCLPLFGGCSDPGAPAPPTPGVATTVTSARPRETAGDDPVLDVLADDPALLAARARARAEIDDVLRRHARSPLSELAIKAPITDGVRIEHVWLADVRYEGGTFIGRVDNLPTRVTTVAEGQELRVEKAKISDYMYEEAGKIHGNHTLRALLPRLPPEDAAAWTERLAPLPEASAGSRH